MSDWGGNPNQSRIIQPPRRFTASQANLAAGGVWSVSHPLYPDPEMVRRVQVWHENWALNTSLDFDAADEANFTEQSPTTTTMRNNAFEWRSPPMLVYTHMDDVAGGFPTVLDSSGNGNHGTCVNMAAGDFGQTAPAGLGTSIQFASASNQYITFGDIANFSIADVFYVCAWFFQTTGTAGGPRTICGRLLANGGGGYVGWQLYMTGGADRRLYFVVRNDNGAVLRAVWKYTTNQLTQNAWHYVMASWGGTGLAANMNLYIDGGTPSITTGGDNLGGNEPTNAAAFEIGASSAGSATSFWDGKLGDIGIFVADAAGNPYLDSATNVKRWNSGNGLPSEKNYWPSSNGRYVTTAAASQINTSTWEGINSALIDLTEPAASTTARLAFSFDNRVTWKYWRGATSAWQNVVLTDIANLAATSGTKALYEGLTKAQWAEAFVPGTLDVAIGIKTTDIDQTPSVTQITFNADLPGHKLATDEFRVSKVDHETTLISNVDAIAHVGLVAKFLV